MSFSLGRYSRPDLSSLLTSESPLFPLNNRLSTTHSQESIRVSSIQQYGRTQRRRQYARPISPSPTLSHCDLFIRGDDQFSHVDINTESTLPRTNTPGNSIASTPRKCSVPLRSDQIRSDYVISSSSPLTNPPHGMSRSMQQPRLLLWLRRKQARANQITFPDPPRSQRED